MDNSTIKVEVMDATSVTITDLKASTCYECYATANTSVGEGAKTNTFSAKTDDDGEH